MRDVLLSLAMPKMDCVTWLAAGFALGMGLAFLLVRIGVQIERGAPARTRLAMARRRLARRRRARRQRGLPSDLLVVFAAAATEVFDRPIRVISARPHPQTEAAKALWSIEGRRQVFLSHNVR